MDAVGCPASGHRDPDDPDLCRHGSDGLDHHTKTNRASSNHSPPRDPAPGRGGFGGTAGPEPFGRRGRRSSTLGEGDRAVPKARADRSRRTPRGREQARQETKTPRPTGTRDKTPLTRGEEPQTHPGWAHWDTTRHTKTQAQGGAAATGRERRHREPHRLIFRKERRRRRAGASERETGRRRATAPITPPRDRLGGTDSQLPRHKRESPGGRRTKSRGESRRMSRCTPITANLQCNARAKDHVPGDGEVIKMGDVGHPVRYPPQVIFDGYEIPPELDKRSAAVRPFLGHHQAPVPHAVEIRLHKEQVRGGLHGQIPRSVHNNSHNLAHGGRVTATHAGTGSSLSVGSMCRAGVKIAAHHLHHDNKKPPSTRNIAPVPGHAAQQTPRSLTNPHRAPSGCFQLNLPLPFRPSKEGNPRHHFPPRPSVSAFTSVETCFLPVGIKRTIVAWSSPEPCSVQKFGGQDSPYTRQLRSQSQQCPNESYGQRLHLARIIQISATACPASPLRCTS